jgi:hypothetical protein
MLHMSIPKFMVLYSRSHRVRGSTVSFSLTHPAGGSLTGARRRLLAAAIRRLSNRTPQARQNVLRRTSTVGRRGS